MKTKLLLILLFTLAIFSFGVGAGLLLSQRAKPSNVLSSSQSSVSSTITPSGNISGNMREKVVVKRVIDGDTIELYDGRKLRYIGIDTPETVHPNRPIGCFGTEASSKNKELVLGKEVSLEKDVSESDKYGRLLRYVYLADGSMVNEFLVKEGYASARTYPPDVKYQEVFLQTEREAREGSKGLWAACMNGKAGENSSLVPQVQGVTTTSESSPVSNANGCTIKGNISANGDKIYHLPNCGSYSKTVIDESAGEHWFCTENEAQQAGWRKAKNC